MDWAGAGLASPWGAACLVQDRTMKGYRQPTAADVAKVRRAWQAYQRATDAFREKYPQARQPGYFQGLLQEPQRR